MAQKSELEKLEQRYRENPSQWFAALADSYRKAGELELALEVVQSGIIDRPDYSSAQIVLGRVLLDLDRDEEASQAFQRVLDLDAENIIALKTLSELSERQLNIPMARAWLKRLLEVDPMNEEAESALDRLGPAQGADVELPVASHRGDDGFIDPEELGPILTDTDETPASILEGASDEFDIQGDAVPSPTSDVTEEEVFERPLDDLSVAERATSESSPLPIEEDVFEVEPEEREAGEALPSARLENVPPVEGLVEAATDAKDDIGAPGGGASDFSIDFEVDEPEPLLGTSRSGDPTDDLQVLQDPDTNLLLPVEGQQDPVEFDFDLEEILQEEALLVEPDEAGIAEPAPLIDPLAAELASADVEPEGELTGADIGTPSIDEAPDSSDDLSELMDVDEVMAELEASSTLGAPDAGPADETDLGFPDAVEDAPIAEDGAPAELLQAESGVDELEDETDLLSLDAVPFEDEADALPASAAEMTGAPQGDKIGEPEPVVTSTMAEVYAQQGLHREAQEIYEQLLDRHPEDRDLQQRLEALRSRRPAPGEIPVDVPEKASRFAVAHTGGVSARARLQQIFSARMGTSAGAEEPVASPPADGIRSDSDGDENDDSPGRWHEG